MLYISQVTIQSRGESGATDGATEPKGNGLQAVQPHKRGTRKEKGKQVKIHPGDTPVEMELRK